MWNNYFLANSLDTALQVLDRHRGNAKIIAGGTDLVLELERSKQDRIDYLIDISRIQGLDQIYVDNLDFIHLGPLVTHSHCVKSELLRKFAYCLVQACSQVGSPQIRNRGTIAGNVATGSPANDSISPLIALNAILCVSSAHEKREIPINDFFTGVRKHKLNNDEIITDIKFRKLSTQHKNIFVKHALRRAQAISLVNLSLILRLDKDGIADDVRIALGSVFPKVLRAQKAEQYLYGKKITKELIEECSAIAATETSPISDLRSSAEYRRNIVSVLVKRGFSNLESAKDNINSVTLWGKEISTYHPIIESANIDEKEKIKIRINGTDQVFQEFHNRTLLRLLRENALLKGTKEGCGEGECGACTVYMDGVAVMACLVPAERAHMTSVVTIEGVTPRTGISPVQQAFIDEGAVQCGYCTPGFVMSATKLLEDNPNPSNDEIRTAISGNLCRCTGYYKIISAIEKAAKL
jgi:xanthine dehydrogenase iron-sulfur cluster and FAD-binding subunit A